MLSRITRHLNGSISDDGRDEDAPEPETIKYYADDSYVKINTTSEVSFVLVEIFYSDGSYIDLSYDLPNGISTDDRFAVPRVCFKTISAVYIIAMNTYEYVVSLKIPSLDNDVSIEIKEDNLVSIPIKWGIGRVSIVKENGKDIMRVYDLVVGSPLMGGIPFKIKYNSDTNYSNEKTYEEVSAGKQYFYIMTEHVVSDKLPLFYNCYNVTSIEYGNCFTSVT